MKRRRNIYMTVLKNRKKVTDGIKYQFGQVEGAYTYDEIRNDMQIVVVNKHVAPEDDSGTEI